MELTVKYLFVALLWALWCTLHSSLIAPTVMDYMERTLGERFRFYRLSYNIVSFATLVPLMYYSISIPQGPVFRWEGHWVIVKYLLLLTSILLFVAGSRHYSMSHFLGLSQIRMGHDSHTLSGHNTFHTSGILGVIRHPWYTGGIIIVWASDISLSTLLINMVIDAYFVIGTILEERKLLLEFGDTYREYQKKVSMFFPYKWLRARMARVLTHNG